MGDAPYSGRTGSHGHASSVRDCSGSPYPLSLALAWLVVSKIRRDLRVLCHGRFRAPPAPAQRGGGGLSRALTWRRLRAALSIEIWQLVVDRGHVDVPCVRSCSGSCLRSILRECRLKRLPTCRPKPVTSLTSYRGVFPRSGKVCRGCQKNSQIEVVKKT